MRFAPDAKMSDINALLETYQATVVGGANGLFRLRENGNLNLLEWGFRFFESHQLYAANTKVATHKVLPIDIMPNNAQHGGAH